MSQPACSASASPAAPARARRSPAAKESPAPSVLAPSTGSHRGADRPAARRGNSALASELDAGDAAVAAELECRCLALEPGQRERLLRVREQHIDLCGRCVEPLDPVRGDQVRGRRVDGEPGGLRTFDRGPRGRLGPRLEKRVAGDEHRAGLERVRHILAGEQRARTGVRHDRRAAEHDDRAGRCSLVAGEQHLHACRGEVVGDQPPGRVGSNAADDRSSCAEAHSGERGVRGRPTGPQLDPPMDATAGNGRGERPIQHDVTHGNQVTEHERTILCRGASVGE